MVLNQLRILTCVSNKPHITNSRRSRLQSLHFPLVTPKNCLIIS